MTKEEVIKIFGIDPDSVGRNKCGWMIQGNTLIVMTKDKDRFSKTFDPMPEFTNQENFMYVSGDVLDKSIMYYNYRPVGSKKRPEETEEDNDSHAARIIKSMRKQDERKKRNESR